jgi:hypothetical protein
MTMPIVFDRVEGVVQRSPETGSEGDEAPAEQAPPAADAEKLAEQLARLQRHRDRLVAD